jgi:putative membrane protein
MPTVPLALSTGLAAAVQLAPLAILVVLYAVRARTLARRGEAVPGWRQACFYGGFAAIAVALVSLGHAGQKLLFVRMIEQLLVGDLAALLIVLGLSAALLAPILRVGVFARLRVLWHPAVALALWVIALLVWHLPVLYEAALRHTGVEALQHALFLGLGINMWMCLLGPLAAPSWFGERGKLLYILTARLAGAALGNLLLWTRSVFYPYYLPGEAHFRISPIADQNIAGAIMLVEEAIILLGLFYWLFKRTADDGARSELRQASPGEPGRMETSTGAP